jgi:hypothetical protein
LLTSFPDPTPEKADKPDEPESFAACSPPDVRTPPSFQIALRQPLRTCLIPVALGDDIDIPALRIGCVKVRDLSLEFAIDMRYTQLWNLIKLGIGDLSSTMGLAPGERLTLEFQSTQRRLLEQSSVDSSEEMTSEESTKIDKEAMNVTRASSRTQNWHVDGGGSFSIGGLGVNASAGVSTSTTKSAQSTIDHVTESSKKSAHNLKTMHKIEVRGVAETILTNRMTRTVHNPYRDRTMSLNVFQLVKHFVIETLLSEVRPVLLIEIRRLAFDDEFVVANGDFLRQELTDPTLTGELPQSTRGALPLLTGGTVEAQRVAKFALKYLYDVPNVFNLPHIRRPFFGTDLGDPNNPSTSFDASRERSGFDDANGDGDSPRGGTAGAIFTTLNVFYKAYQDRLANDPLAPDEVALAGTLAADLASRWTTLQADEKLATWLQDNSNFTEIFRRLSGFLAIVNGMLTPLLARVEAEKARAAERESDLFALQRLKSHLDCNRHYYIQRFLAYLSRKTLGLGITDFVDLLFGRTGISAVVAGGFDMERAFVDRDTIVVPWHRGLSEDELRVISDAVGPGNSRFSFSDVVPKTAALEVPTDGIHLEVAPGACILEDLPEADGSGFELSVKDAVVKCGP